MFVEVAIRNCVWWLRRANVTMLETKLNVWFRSNVHKLKKILQRSRQQGVCVFSFPLLFVVLLFFLYSSLWFVVAVDCVRFVVCAMCVCVYVCCGWRGVCLYLLGSVSFVLPLLRFLYNVIVCIAMDHHHQHHFFLNMFVCVCVKGREKERIRIE